MQFVSSSEGLSTQDYPANPNGSINGITGVCSRDGRRLQVMPHPERAFLGWQCHDTRGAVGRDEYTPWFKMFTNAYEWCKSHQ